VCRINLLRQTTFDAADTQRDAKREPGGRDDGGVASASRDTPAGGVPPRPAPALCKTLLPLPGCADRDAWESTLPRERWDPAPATGGLAITLDKRESSSITLLSSSDEESTMCNDYCNSVYMRG